jgi:hypothetical protein
MRETEEAVNSGREKFSKNSLFNRGILGKICIAGNLLNQRARIFTPYALNRRE